MKFAVKAWSNGRARAGLLQVGSCELETPALLLTTRKGLPVFISPDLLPSLPSPDSRLLQFSPLHFLDAISPKTMSEIGGLHQMLGLKEHIFVAVPRDSILSLPDYGSTNRIGASFETPCGRRLIKPAEYMQMISSMKPNMWATLADEVPAWVSEKRNRASVDRTVRWMNDCITSNLATTSGGAVFGSIVGGSSVEERQHCAQEVAQQNVSGYYIGGFGLGESMEERPALLSAVTDILPDEKPRQISGLGLPGIFTILRKGALHLYFIQRRDMVTMINYVILAVMTQKLILAVMTQKLISKQPFTEKICRQLLRVAIVTHARIIRRHI